MVTFFIPLLLYLWYGHLLYLLRRSWSLPCSPLSSFLVLPWSSTQWSVHTVWHFKYPAIITCSPKLVLCNTSQSSPSCLLNLPVICIPSPIRDCTCRNSSSIRDYTCHHWLLLLLLISPCPTTEWTLSVTVEDPPISFSPFSLADCSLFSHFSFNYFITTAFPDLAEDLDIQI